MQTQSFAPGGPVFSFLSGSIRQGLAMDFALPALAVDAQGLEAEAAAQALSRPRNCLVLSGGEGPGAARVGVLQVLDELRVPLQWIAGTIELRAQAGALQDCPAASVGSG